MFPHSTENSWALVRQIWAFLFLLWADFQVASSIGALLTFNIILRSKPLCCLCWIYFSINHPCWTDPILCNYMWNIVLFILQFYITSSNCLKAACFRILTTFDLVIFFPSQLLFPLFSQLFKSRWWCIFYWFNDLGSPWFYTMCVSIAVAQHLKLASPPGFSMWV